MPFKPGQVFKVKSPDGDKIYVFKGECLLKYVFVDITPGGANFGEEVPVDYGKRCRTLLRENNATPLGTLKKKEIDRLLKSPEGASEVQERTRYHQATA